MFEVLTMQIPCVSCQSVFHLDNCLVKATGSLVRCSICKNIFKVYPPAFDDVQVAKDTDVDQPILDDLTEVKQANMATGLPDQTSEEINGYRIDEIASLEDFDGEVDDQDPESEDTEHSDYTDLSEYDDKIDWEDFPDAGELTEH